MAKHVLKIYPVANGDTTLIKLSDLSTILIDCKIRSEKEDQSGNAIFDVKSDLLSEVQKRDSKPFIDLFILSHPDEDHCLGFAKTFYKGDPSGYSDKNKENNEIMIDELWVTSNLFNNAVSEDAKAIKREAERRRKLWTDDDSKKNISGNKIRMIGYDGDSRFDKVPNNVPGDTVSLKEINGKSSGNFEIFIHGPFKKSLIIANSEKDKNFSSIILQLRFKEYSYNNWSFFFLTGGDADHYRWKEVLEKSIKYKNEEKLKWDLFQTPHHCSWTFFNDVPYENEVNQSPKESSLKILDYGKEGAYIVASSRKIINEKPNPPHQAAKDEYLNKVKASNFLNTNINGSEKEPKPIVFEISGQGFSRTDTAKTQDEKNAGATTIASKSVMTGNWCNYE